MILVLESFSGNAYFYIAIAFSTFFVLQGIFTFIGVGDSFEIDTDFDADVDFDVDMTNGVGMTLHLFSIRGIIAFFMMFGWTGYFMSRTMTNQFLILIVSFIAGGIMLFLVSLIYYFVSKLSQDGTLVMKSVIGKIGTVYIPIPDRKEGIGKVQILAGGSLQTLDAIAKDKSIKRGQQVKVVAVENNMLEVEEII